jgi:hypothetical protein
VAATLALTRASAPHLQRLLHCEFLGLLHDGLLERSLGRGLDRGHADAADAASGHRERDREAVLLDDLDARLDGLFGKSLELLAELSVRHQHGRLLLVQRARSHDLVRGGGGGLGGHRLRVPLGLDLGDERGVLLLLCGERGRRVAQRADAARGLRRGRLGGGAGGGGERDSNQITMAVERQVRA